MFVQYSFVERRSHADMQTDPIQLSDTTVFALGVTFMAVISLGYAIMFGL